jgi:hypothetical protein
MTGASASTGRTPARRATQDLIRRRSHKRQYRQRPSGLREWAAKWPKGFTSPHDAQHLPEAALLTANPFHFGDVRPATTATRPATIAAAATRRQPPFQASARSTVRFTS